MEHRKRERRQPQRDSLLPVKFFVVVGVILAIIILLADELLSLLYSLRGKSRLTLIERLLGYHKS